MISFSLQRQLIAFTINTIQQQLFYYKPQSIPVSFLVCVGCNIDTRAYVYLSYQDCKLWACISGKSFILMLQLLHTYVATYCMCIHTCIQYSPHLSLHMCVLFTMCSSILFEASAEAHMLHTCESCQCRTRICVKFQIFTTLYMQFCYVYFRECLTEPLQIIA